MKLKVKALCMRLHHMKCEYIGAAYMKHKLTVCWLALNYTVFVFSLSLPLSLLH